jgi:LacI family transcriptional regulator
MPAPRHPTRSDATEDVPPRPATRADVARRAGVSTAVVSYVVNGGPRAVAPETAARVRVAVEALRYRPNANARALRRGTTEMLGLVLPDIGNPFFAEYALAIEAAAAARGRMLVVCNTDADPAKEREIVRDLAGRHVDGLMICTVHGAADLPGLGYANRPTVFIDSTVAVPGYRALGPDAATGSWAAVEHLIATHGISTIALIIGPSGDPLPEPRERGWSAAFRAHDLPPGPIVRTTFSRHGGNAAAQEILAWPTRPGAVFVASDQQATGVLSAIRQAGLRCPEDIAVVSFDGTEESQYCWPPLTSVRQPVHDMAEAAVTAVLELGPRKQSFDQYPMELVIRESCGCPAKSDDDRPPSVVPSDGDRIPATVAAAFPAPASAPRFGGGPPV